ncbi:hypothetical protein [Arthrobacter globiformis]|uniref:hypothetical protein n=1 Tax=Arthrobacter globiformis TaxID=1665 RepID=UPI00279430F3|nr:hypothetical protein [Arthrobacter globiformis]MDQ0616580.1 hypothetical protein [Arthrobacter globiformis]
MGNTPARPGRRNVALIGANFGLALHPVDRKGVHIAGEPASCFASFWVADWSRWGTGTVLMVATLQGWRSYGSNESFASSLATELTRFFPEAARFPLAGVSHTQDEFDVELDLERGFRATGRRAALEISGVLDRRQFSAPDFQLGPASASMSNVYHPCSGGKLSEFGVEWPGAATVYPGPRGPSSSAYMAVAESWSM